MGNVRQKPPDQLVNRRGGRGRGLTVVGRDPSFVAPVPPEDVGPAGKRAWTSFWRSSVSAAVDLDADMTELEHWVRCVDERARLWEIVRESPLIPSGGGNLVVNPLSRGIRDLTQDIDRISDRFGMNPMSRFRLQLTVSEAGKSSNELLRMLTDGTAEPMNVNDVIELDAL